MPSRERRLVVVALALTGVAMIALAGWSLVARSALPLSLDGTVTSVEVRHEKHPGVDDAWFVALDGGRPRHLDRDVAALLEPGDRVTKDAWSRTVTVDGTTHPVAPGPDARRFLLLAPGLLLAVAGLGVVAARRS